MSVPESGRLAPRGGNLKHEFDLSEATLQRLFAAKDPKTTMDRFLNQLLDTAGLQTTVIGGSGPPENVNEVVRRFEEYLARRTGVAFCHESDTMNVWEIPVRYEGRRRVKKLFVGANGSGLVQFPVTELWGDRRRRERWIAKGVRPPQAVKKGRFSGWRAYASVYIRKSGDGLETAKDFLLEILDV